MSAEPTAVLKSLAGVAVPLQGVALSGVIEGSLLQFTVEQRYCNTEDQAIEALYTFPLPVQAVLLSLELTLGERTLTGVVQRKQEAVAAYETAIEDGDTAILLEKASDGLFTVSLGNLLPGEQAVIRYRYAQVLAFEQGQLRMALPMTIAPRYGNAHAALLPHQQPDTDITVSYPCTLTLQVRGELAAANVLCPTHTLSRQLEQGVLTLRDSGNLVLDRDLVLLIEGTTAGAQSLLACDGDDYVALASFTVPVSAKPVRDARAVKLLVDCSGSMDGDGIKQARAAMLATLSSLQSADLVSLTRFGSTVQHVTDGLQLLGPATTLALNKAVRATQADLGGTEMLEGIEAVLAIPAPAGLVADVLMITDGEIWEVDTLLERIATAGHRLFVIAVGATPNEELARKVAALTRGACEFVTPNENMKRAVQRLLARMAAPVLRVDAVQWPQTPAWTVGVGDLVFPGDTVHVLAGFNSRPAGQVTVSIAGADQPCLQTLSLSAAVSIDTTLARLGAARRLETLSPEAAAVLAEQHQLVTRFTSCVVVMKRDDAQRSYALPAVRKVPSMMAASFGGSSTVCFSMSAPAVKHMHDSNASYQQAIYLSRSDSIRFELWKQEFASSLAAHVLSGGAIPQTLAQLVRIQKPLPPIYDLLELIERGAREVDVVAAWLANLCEEYGQDCFPDRLQRRLLSAADRQLREHLRQL